MKLIGLTGKYGSVIGNYAQVDDTDYEMLNKWKWFASKRKSCIYASTCIGKDIEKNRSKPDTVTMHSMLMEKEVDKMIDHKDNNGLNNQRENLRLVTNYQNAVNRKKSTKKQSSIYKGVTAHKCDLWQGSITKNGKTQYCWKKTEIEAALWYNEKAIELHGEYAKINVI